MKILKLILALIAAVNRVLFEDKSAQEAMWELMEREQTNASSDLEWN